MGVALPTGDATRVTAARAPRATFATRPLSVAVNGPLLTTRQVAEMLGISSATVLRRWRAGELPGYRISSNALRFDEHEIDAWLAERRGPTSDALKSSDP